MLSPNESVKKGYYSALSNITYDGQPVKYYYGQLPTDIAPGIYIIASAIRNNDDSNKTSAVTQTSVTVSIYTNHVKYADGIAVDAVANEVLNRIMPTTTYKLPLPNSFFQIITTTLQSDILNDFSQQNQLVYIDRILTFSHTISQNVS